MTQASLTYPTMTRISHQRSHLIAKRCISSTSSRMIREQYIDQWFQSIMKEDSFYDNAASGKTRRYFYTIDLNGRLFLEQTFPKNITSSIKDPKFLNFFFRNLQYTGQRESSFLQESGVERDYPFVSLCGLEVNYIRPACTPIVFHSLVNNDLAFGGSMTQRFDYSYLALSKYTGKIYHQLRVPLKNGSGNEDFGLLRSTVAIALSDNITPGNTDDDPWTIAREDGAEVPIQWLPEYSEPGSWAMPEAE